MGIFKKLKNLFSKNIDVSKQLDDAIMYRYVPKGRKIQLGENIIVKDGYCAVFVCRNKICDILKGGKYKIDLVTVPLAYKRNKLDKPDKDGKTRTEIKCDIYFICEGKKEDIKFDSYEPIRRKCNFFNRVIAYTEGLYDFQITDIVKFIKHITREYGLVNEKRAFKEISYEIGNYVNKVLARSPMRVEDMLKDNTAVFRTINQNVDSAFENIGLWVKNLRVKNIRVSGKVTAEKSRGELLPDLPPQFTNEEELVNVKEAALKEQVEVPVFNPFDAKVGNDNNDINTFDFDSKDVVYNSTESQPVIDSVEIKEDVIPDNIIPIEQKPLKKHKPLGNTVTEPINMEETKIEKSPLDVQNEEKNIPDALGGDVGKAKRACLYCGGQINSTAVFCEHCGFKQDLN